MRKLNVFRIVNEFEKSIILKTLGEICQNSDIFRKNFKDKLYISFDRTSYRDQNPSIYIISTKHQKLIEQLDKNTQITSGGLYFGFFKKESFRLSLEGAEFLVNSERLIEDQILIIDANGEKSVLYGNDIKKGNVINIPANLRKDDLLVIMNEQNEFCAIAQSLINKQVFTRINPRDNIALNLIDKGYYLRKTQ
jgi:ribosome biogenesis protein Nip4